MPDICSNNCYLYNKAGIRALVIKHSLSVFPELEFPRSRRSLIVGEVFDGGDLSLL